MHWAVQKFGSSSPPQEQVTNIKNPNSKGRGTVASLLSLPISLSTVKIIISYYYFYYQVRKVGWGYNTVYAFSMYIIQRNILAGSHGHQASHATPSSLLSLVLYQYCWSWSLLFFWHVAHILSPFFCDEVEVEKIIPQIKIHYLVSYTTTASYTIRCIKTLSTINFFKCHLYTIIPYLKRADICTFGTTSNHKTSVKFRARLPHACQANKSQRLINSTNRYRK